MNKAFKKYTGIKYKNTGIGKRHKRKSLWRTIQAASVAATGSAQLSAILSSGRRQGKRLAVAELIINTAKAMNSTLKRNDR